MRSRMGVPIGLILVVGAGLTACASGGGLRFAAEPTIYPPAVFAHRVMSSHVAIYWNCDQSEPGMMRVHGVAQNPWGHQEVRFLELELVGVDARERSASHVATALPEYLLRTNQTSPFQLDLRTKGTEVRFDLFYQYRFNEGEGNRLIAGVLPGGSLLMAQPQRRFMARDVCSETQHRVR